MAVGFIEGLLRMGTTCTLKDWVPSSTVVLFLFSCIQVFRTFCNSDFFDLSPCRSSFRSFKALHLFFGEGGGGGGGWRRGLSRELNYVHAALESNGYPSKFIKNIHVKRTRSSTTNASPEELVGMFFKVVEPTESHKSFASPPYIKGVLN